MSASLDPSGSPSAYAASIEPAPAPSEATGIFKGPNGLRAGWRLLIFFAILFILSLGLNFTIRHIPSLAAAMKPQSSNEMTPATVIFGEGSAVFLLLVALSIMALIEKRSFADYYLPLSEAFAKRFWQGIPYGFAMLSLLLATIAALHGFSLQGFALGGAVALEYGALYGIGFILVAMFEEFAFRGYMQSTLGSGIGFWPAAAILSLLFGAIHLQNPSEAWFGAVMAGSFGLLAAFALSRTGNIWFPIGMHAAWDWGETYFYGVADSGFVAQGHLLNSSLQGNKWLTGGIVGPEGSVFALVVLVLGGIGIHFLFPAKRVVS
ncbi:MAG TPA: CPBP family intramembrane glutamic endopeptidase [Candidatus Acidoferrales bacterium]